MIYENKKEPNLSQDWGQQCPITVEISSKKDDQKVKHGMKVYPSKHTITFLMHQAGY